MTRNGGNQSDDVDDQRKELVEIEMTSDLLHKDVSPNAHEDDVFVGRIGKSMKRRL